MIRTFRLGEADRVVTLATPDQGKVRAVAKGVRRTKSRLGARLEPLGHVTVLCWKGRQLDVVREVELLEPFRRLREDFERLSSATTMLEVVDQLSLEGNPMPELFTLLLRALRTLETTGSSLVLGAFCWKVLALEGIAPMLHACARCGGAGELVAFDPLEGGFLCQGCRRGQAVSPDALQLIRRILGGDLAGALAEAPGKPAEEAERLATAALEHHLDRRLRSTRHSPAPASHATAGRGLPG